MTTREQEIRNWSMLCHFSALAGLLVPLGSILGPLIVWQMKKSDLPEIDLHGKESLNFQISMLVINLIISFFLFGTVGFGALSGSLFIIFVGGGGLAVLLFIVRLIAWVLVVIAGVNAANGQVFRYPSIRFIR